MILNIVAGILIAAFILAFWQWILGVAAVVAVVWGALWIVGKILKGIWNFLNTPISWTPPK